MEKAATKSVFIVLTSLALLFTLAGAAAACSCPDCPECHYSIGDPPYCECVPYGDCWGGCPDCETCVDCYCDCTSVCGCDGKSCSGCCECSGCDCVNNQSNCTGECKTCAGCACIDDDSKCSGCCECENGNCVDVNSNCDQEDCQMCDGCGCVTDPDETTEITSWEDWGDCDNPVPNPGSGLSPNGCSTPTGDNPTGCEDTSFLGPCNAHDICYQKCNTSKSSGYKDGCDDDFLGEVYGDTCTGMLCICVNSSSCAYPCSVAAYIYYGAVDIVGDSFYQNAQVGACACCNCN